MHKYTADQKPASHHNFSNLAAGSCAADQKKWFDIRGAVEADDAEDSGGQGKEATSTGMYL